MKTIFTPFLALLLFSILTYVVWRNFEFDYMLGGEISQTKGVIFETRAKVTARGMGTLQIIEYAFENNGEYFFGRKQIGSSEKWQFLGNTVNIEFEKENPERSNITRFNNNFQKNSEQILYSNTDIGYCQMKKTNNLIDYTEFGKKGVVVYKMIGVSTDLGDTLKIQPLRINEETLKSSSIEYLTLIDSLGNRRLKNIETGRTLE